MRLPGLLLLAFGLLLPAPAPAQTPVRDREDGELLEALVHPNPVVRVRAATELGRRRAVRAVGPLLQRLSDEEPIVRARAAEALRQIGDERAVPGLARALGDPDFTTRCRAVLALGDLADLYVVPIVRRMLDDEAAVVRAAAARALGELGDPLSLEDVLACQARETEDPDGAVTAAALVSAAKLGGPGGLRRSVRIAGERISRSWFLRAVLARAAGIAEDRDRVPDLAALLAGDPDPRVAEAAAGALASMGETGTLRSALAFPEPFRRRAAVAAFGEIGGEAAREVLFEAVRDEDPGVRLEAAAALFGRGEKDAAPVLIRLLEEVDASVWMGALAALEQRTGRELGRDPPAWTRFWRESGDGLRFQPGRGRYEASR